MSAIMTPSIRDMVSLYEHSFGSGVDFSRCAVRSASLGPYDPVAIEQVEASRLGPIPNTILNLLHVSLRHRPINPIGAPVGNDTGIVPVHPVDLGHDDPRWFVVKAQMLFDGERYFNRLAGRTRW